MIQPFSSVWVTVLASPIKINLLFHCIEPSSSSPCLWTESAWHSPIVKGRAQKDKLVEPERQFVGVDRQTVLRLMADGSTVSCSVGCKSTLITCSSWTHQTQLGWVFVTMCVCEGDEKSWRPLRFTTDVTVSPNERKQWFGWLSISRWNHRNVQQINTPLHEVVMLIINSTMIYRSCIICFFLMGPLPLCLLNVGARCDVNIRTGKIQRMFICDPFSAGIHLRWYSLHHHVFSSLSVHLQSTWTSAMPKTCF